MDAASLGLKEIDPALSKTHQEFIRRINYAVYELRKGLNKNLLRLLSGYVVDAKRQEKYYFVRLSTVSLKPDLKDKRLDELCLAGGTKVTMCLPEDCKDIQCGKADLGAVSISSFYSPIRAMEPLVLDNVVFALKKLQGKIGGTADGTSWTY